MDSAPANPLSPPSELNVTSAASADLAPDPPMGWNSWNSFATTISEAEALETAGKWRRAAAVGFDRNSDHVGET